MTVQVQTVILKREQSELWRNLFKLYSIYDKRTTIKLIQPKKSITKSPSKVCKLIGVSKGIALVIRPQTKMDQY
jgi:hypothetical protein